LRVEKRRVAVRISQSGHGPMDVFFCLASTSREAALSILEQLNSPRRAISFISTIHFDWDQRIRTT